VVERVEDIKNDSPTVIDVRIEPWGATHRVSVGGQLRIVARSLQDGGFETVRDGNVVTVYAWAGATAQVFDGGVLVHDFPVPIPDVPPNMSMRAFIKLMLR
jgi:hypothetical protein